MIKITNGNKMMYENLVYIFSKNIIQIDSDLRRVVCKGAILATTKCVLGYLIVVNRV